MKKLLGLLAMILVISSLSLAENDQDILKNISLDSKWSQTYYDKDGNDANRLGNEGFKKKNKERFRWTEEVEGTLGLNNEWGLDANFHYREHNDRFYEDGKRTQAKGAEKISVIEFAKAAQWGSLNTTTKLGWRNWTYRENGGVGSQHTVGQSNEFSVWTHLGYKADIDTPVGVITINSRIGYRPVDKNYKKGNAWKYDYYNSDSKRKIEEENELNFGLKVGLAVK